jgi:hypothetical protein
VHKFEIRPQKWNACSSEGVQSTFIFFDLLCDFSPQTDSFDKMKPALEGKFKKKIKFFKFDGSKLDGKTNAEQEDLEDGDQVDVVFAE